VARLSVSSRQPATLTTSTSPRSRVRRRSSGCLC